MVAGNRACKAQARSATLQRLQPSELRASKHGLGRYSRKAFRADWLWSADVHNCSADRLDGRRFRRRQQSTYDRVSGAAVVLAAVTITYWHKCDIEDRSVQLLA